MNHRLAWVSSLAPFRPIALLGFALACFAAAAWMLGEARAADARTSLLQLSADPFTNTDAQHDTEVESDNFAYNNTMIGVFQVGRYPDSNAGSTDIGWSTTSNDGKTWKFGFLPGITKTVNPKNPYDRVTDPAVAYDAKHNVWMVVSLPYGTYGGVTTYLVPIVSRSPDGLKWQNPVHVAPDNGDFMDKPWIVCDNSTKSHFYGNCYVEFIDVNLGEVLLMSTSHDGGATWSTPVPSADQAVGNGGQPIVQPNGTVLVPFWGFSGIATVNSVDGGNSWQASVFIAVANEAGLPGGLRDPGPLPSAELDGAGKAYVAWQDCSFELNCATNDIVFSTSPDGQQWSPVQRVPIGKVGSGQTDFIPGMGVDRATTGSKAHLGVTYYYVANANCSGSTCQIFAGFIASSNAGKTWNKPVALTGPMQPGWLPNSDLGYMIGDYSATSFVGGLARSTMPVAAAPKNGKFQQAVFTTTKGLPASLDGPQLSSAGERPYPQTQHRVWRPVPILH